ncbi:cytochrome-c peroxidase [Aquimarina hainanensis]|uniref:Cytochrome-c peroxidase n=1 Tax=Aquimarina hainanensis TaxID=1578017 RepID=A0ABW5NE49_9FLAO
MFLTACKQSPEKTEAIPPEVLSKNKFTRDITLAIQYLDSIIIDSTNAKKHFLTSRKYFKYMEPLLASLDEENYNFLNQPNILKIEEEDYTDIKIKSPGGYQVIEETLFADTLIPDAITRHTTLAKNRLKLVKKNISFKHIKPYHFLWMFRKGIHRVALTGITGFDSPVLENSLFDAQSVYTSLKEYLSFYKTEFQEIQLYQAWNREIDQTILSLQGDFNDFDRYHFIKNHTHPQMELWKNTVTDWHVTFPFELAIKNEATSLFSNSTFNTNYFSDRNSGAITKEKIALGKKLFNDTNLSANQKISCATCHLKEKGFTDGLKTPKGLTRNSPTLLYASLQKAFFYDKRAGSLEGQIVSVVNNKNEFHTNLLALETVIKTDSSYRKQFADAYSGQDISEKQIRNAIANYIRSLTPFNSKFDNNINGLENTLTASEINGFNLFNGKAKCATCHFPPLFNGTVPPNYKESEIELLGVPSTNDTINAMISDDLGRYYVYKTPERKHFFKTSTVRNVSKTAPYMHNGVYTTLEEVIDFYNRGGGSGIGIHQEYQTLPSDPLHLNQQEINDLIAFMNALEDY